MDAEKASLEAQPKYLDNAFLHRQDAAPATGNTSHNSKSNAQHALFCSMVGMPEDFDSKPYPSIWNVFSTKEKALKGIYPRTVHAYQWHTFQYWLVACMSNSILWTQICLGAVLTALGGLKTDRVSVAIIVLGAIQTVFGGFSTYFKSRNQPNRARQFRIGLKRVLDAIENAENMFRSADFVPPPYTPLAVTTGPKMSPDGTIAVAVPGVEVRGVEGMVLRLLDMYQDAVQEAQNNYPDFWKANDRAIDQAQFTMTKDLLDHLKSTGAAVVKGNGIGSVRKNSDDVPVQAGDHEAASDVDQARAANGQATGVFTSSGAGGMPSTIARRPL